MNPQQYPTPGQQPAAPPSPPPQPTQGPQVPPVPPQGPYPSNGQVPQPSNGQNPYDFILNSGNQAPKGRFNLPQGNSSLQRALIFGGGLVLLLVVGLIFLSVMSGGGGRNEQIIGLAQEQTEIVRIADLARNEQTVRDTKTSNLATSTSLSVNTSLQQTMGLISGKPPAPKVLVLKRDAKIDALLEEAATNNQYDETFTETLNSKLKAYQKSLRDLFSSSNNDREKAVLQAAYDGTVILLNEHQQQAPN